MSLPPELLLTGVEAKQSFAQSSFAYFSFKKTGGSDRICHSHRNSYLRAQKGNEVSHKVLCQAGQKYFARLQILQSVSVCKICVDCT